RAAPSPMSLSRASPSREEHRRRRLLPSGACALTAFAVQIDSPVGDCDAEGSANCARHKTDLSAMRAHEFGGNSKAEACSTGPSRTLERLEQVSTRLFGHALAGIRDFNHDHATFAPSGNANLITRRIARTARFQRLHRIAR